MRSPRYPAAVVAAMSRPRNRSPTALPARSAWAGTMNNFTFGNERYPVLRDDLRRLRRGPDFDGTDRDPHPYDQLALTDPGGPRMALPSSTARRSVRGSGGRASIAAATASSGAPLREAMTAAITTGHRRARLRMGAGAPSAATGSEAHDGTREDSDATHAVAMNAEDVFVIATPGGGGLDSAECEERRNRGASVSFDSAMRHSRRGERTVVRYLPHRPCSNSGRILLHA